MAKKTKKCKKNTKTYSVEITESLLFIWIFFIVVFSWLIVDLVGRAFNNFTFVTLKMDEKNTVHTVIIALAVIAIVIACVFYLKTLNYDMEYDFFEEGNDINEGNDADDDGDIDMFDVIDDPSINREGRPGFVEFISPLEPLDFIL